MPVPDASRVLGSLEAEVMDVVWASGGPVTVREVLSRLNDGRDSALAYTTVMTVLARLAEKDILTRARVGKGFAYEATVPDAAGIAVRNLMRDFGDAAVVGFIDEARADPKLRARLRRLLEDG